MSYHQQATIIIMSTQIIVIEIIIFLWSILTVLLSHALFLLQLFYFLWSYFVYAKEIPYYVSPFNPTLYLLVSRFHFAEDAGSPFPYHNPTRLASQFEGRNSLIRTIGGTGIENIGRERPRIRKDLNKVSAEDLDESRHFVARLRMRSSSSSTWSFNKRT